MKRVEYFISEFGFQPTPSTDTSSNQNVPRQITIVFHHYTIPEVNAIRRTILQYVPCLAIQRVDLHKNTTRLLPEIIEHHLAFLPIACLHPEQILDMPFPCQSPCHSSRPIPTAKKDTNTILTVGGARTGGADSCPAKYGAAVCGAHNNTNKQCPNDSSIQDQDQSIVLSKQAPDGSDCCIHCSVTFRLDVRNDGKEVAYVSGSDLQLHTNVHNLQIIPNGEPLFPIYPGQELSLTAYAIKGNGKQDARWLPVAKCYYDPTTYDKTKTITMTITTPEQPTASCPCYKIHPIESIKIAVDALIDNYDRLTWDARVYDVQDVHVDDRIYDPLAW